MPDVSSFVVAVRLRLVVYQLFEPRMPIGSSITDGVVLSSQNDFEDETVRPALSLASMSTLCLPSGSLNPPDPGKVIQVLLSRLYSKVDKPEPGVGSEAEAFNTAAVYQLFEPSVPLRLALRLGFCVSSEAL